MRNRESKIDSFSILLTILLGFNSRIDSKKKIHDRPKNRNRNRKGIRFDTALLYTRCFDVRFAPDGRGEFTDPLVTDVTEDKYVYVNKSRLVVPSWIPNIGNCESWFLMTQFFGMISQVWRRDRRWGAVRQGGDSLGHSLRLLWRQQVCKSDKIGRRRGLV